MTFTINIVIEENLSPSEVLKEMKEGAITWGKATGLTPIRRYPIKQIKNNYYMKVDYASRHIHKNN